MTRGLRQGPSKALKIPVEVCFQWSQKRGGSTWPDSAVAREAVGSVIPGEEKLAGSGGFPLHYGIVLGDGSKMRHIDIDSLSEDELIELNHKVVARLRFLHQMRSHSAMLDFRIGERVKFHPDGRPVVFGTLTRYNKKTVTVVTDAGENWNVAPGLLSKADPASTRKGKPEDGGVVPFPDRAAEK